MSAINTTKIFFRRKGLSVVEIMIVFLVVVVVFAIAVPLVVRSRELSRAGSCRENLARIEGAKAQWAPDCSLGIPPPTWEKLIGATLYLKRTPVCPCGGVYSINDLNTFPTCSYTAPMFLGKNPKLAHRLK